MPRPHRHLPEGYSFHITLRCNSRAFLIAKRIRRDLLLVVLAKAQQKVHHNLYGVCLMANHIHLLLRPLDATQLPKLMHWIAWYSAMASQPPFRALRALLGGKVLRHCHCT